jgi:microcystin-dependent protein
MPTLTIPNSFTVGGTILSSEHNANNNAIATFLNSTKLDADNLQDNAITTAKITDLSVTEAKLAAAVVAKLLPPGVVSAYTGTAAPTGWLLCDGTAVSRSTYSALFAVIGESCGQGDNSTTFNLPDYRGRFLRGVDGAAGIDLDKATRTAMATGGNTANNVGSVQTSATALPTTAFTTSDPGNHDHGISNTDTVPLLEAGASWSTSGASFGSANHVDEGAHTHTLSGGDAETRPANANVNFIIKI